MDEYEYLFCDLKEFGITLLNKSAKCLGKNKFKILIIKYLKILT